MRTKLYFLLIFTTLIAFSCNKEHSCYDENMYLEHKDAFCTADCPGVIGCDGKKYCNECEANRQGIRVD